MGSGLSHTHESEVTAVNRCPSRTQQPSQQTPIQNGRHYYYTPC